MLQLLWLLKAVCSAQNTAPQADTAAAALDCRRRHAGAAGQEAEAVRRRQDQGKTREPSGEYQGKMRRCEGAVAVAERAEAPAAEERGGH